MSTGILELSKKLLFKNNPQIKFTLRLFNKNLKMTLYSYNTSFLISPESCNFLKLSKEERTKILSEFKPDKNNILTKSISNMTKSVQMSNKNNDDDYLKKGENSFENFFMSTIEKMNFTEKEKDRKGKIGEVDEDNKELKDLLEKIYLETKNNINLNCEVLIDNKSIRDSFTLMKRNKTPILPSKNYLNQDNFSNHNLYNTKKEISIRDIEFENISVKQEVTPPSLAFNLDTIVQNPGIYKLKDIMPDNENSKKKIDYFNYLPTPEDIKFENLDNYLNPFEDSKLHNLVMLNNKKLCSSTSGLSFSLCHFYYLLSNFKSPQFYGLSHVFNNEPNKFMIFIRKPTIIKVKKHNEGFYSISNCSLFNDKNEIILLKMGKYMEKLLTSTEKEFQKKYIKSKATDLVINANEDYFNYIGFDKILLRSQIDCSAEITNSVTGVKEKILFEIKTRACSPIRYDIHNYKDYLDYEINKIYGHYSSYEREYYDLIRGAFLKYLFQMKIGGMDGAFIAYHNTEKIYGFEYIKLKDMEMRIFGNCLFSDIIFKTSLKLIQEVYLEILSNYNNTEKILMGVYSNECKKTLEIFVEELDDYSIYDDINRDDFYFITNYYMNKKLKPKIDKYSVSLNIIHNNVISSFTPILFEKGDNYHVKYDLKYLGRVDFNEYMNFLHEAYYYEEINMENQYNGIWSEFYKK